MEFILNKDIGLNESVEYNHSKPTYFVQPRPIDVGLRENSKNIGPNIV